MKPHPLLSVAAAALSAASLAWLGGCSGDAKTPSKPQEGHAAHDHQGDGHDHAADAHHDKPLTEKDVEIPATFAAGVDRLKELHGAIAKAIEQGEFAKVHQVAEEAALVARKMKELARKEVPEDRQTEAGRLCNEVAGYFQPLDEASHDGDKAQLEAIHQKMGDAIERLGEIAR